jgi:hypothetical protein
MSTQTPNKNFKQSTAFMRATDKSIAEITIRVRCIFHDAGLLFVSITNNSLNAHSTKGKEQNELHFWTRSGGGISNV